MFARIETKLKHLVRSQSATQSCRLVPTCNILDQRSGTLLSKPDEPNRLRLRSEWYRQPDNITLANAVSPISLLSCHSIIFKYNRYVYILGALCRFTCVNSNPEVVKSIPIMSFACTVTYFVWNHLLYLQILARSFKINNYAKRTNVLKEFFANNIINRKLDQKHLQSNWCQNRFYRMLWRGYSTVSESTLERSQFFSLVKM